jgi:hypothetical protein
MADDEDKKVDAAKSDANTLLAGGFGIGAFGLISAAVGGAVCPVCVVAAPVLLGVGAFSRWRIASRGRREASSAEPHDGSGGSYRANPKGNVP